MFSYQVFQAALPLLVIYFIVGCVAGSFVNVCIYRLPLGMSLVRPASACIRCGQPLGVLDMVPVLGWLILGGRCRYCRDGISWRYPAVEFLCGLLFVICGLVLLPGIRLWLAFIFTACLLVHMGTDLEHQLLFDRVTTLLVPTGVIYSYYTYGDLWISLYGASAAGTIMYAVYLASRGGMGFGDVKLVFALGVWLGWQGALCCLLLAFVSGGAVGAALVASGFKKRRDRIAFGPFLCGTGYVTLLWGDGLLHWYLRFFS